MRFDEGRKGSVYKHAHQILKEQHQPKQARKATHLLRKRLSPTSKRCVLACGYLILLYGSLSKLKLFQDTGDLRSVMSAFPEKENNFDFFFPTMIPVEIICSSALDALTINRELISML